MTHQLALALAAYGGTVVVANRAGELVATTDTFRRNSGNVDDPKSLGAWLDFSTTHDHRYFHTWGMAAFAHLDIAVELSGRRASRASRRRCRSRSTHLLSDN
jgi:hypothetical protein